MPLSNSTVNNRVTQSGPLTDDASFQFVDVRDLGMIDLLLNKQEAQLLLGDRATRKHTKDS